MTIIDGHQDTVVLLGKYLTLPPAAESSAGVAPTTGSIRFNPISQQVELYNNPPGWKLPNSQTLSPEDFLSKTGGMVKGDVIGQSSIWGIPGSTGVPSYAFVGHESTGISEINGVLNISVGGVVQMQATNADLQIPTLNVGSASIGSVSCATLITPSISTFPYELQFFSRGKPQSSQILTRRILTVDCTFAINFGESRAVARTAPTQNAALLINLIRSGSSSLLGQLLFSASSNSGSFSMSSAANLLAGDIIEFVAPASVDSTLSDIAITVVDNRNT